ncbi:MAG: RHS repeat protein [Gammaproteobacteria bacterium]|nr:MAG: RHS repeat protein [Gammaproteobacteria bacterium]
MNGWTWGNGTYEVRTYDQDGKISQVDGSGLKTYGYDDAFRIIGIADTVNSAFSWTYGYDALDRLSSASATGQSQSFTYDATGNRLTQGGTLSSTYTVSAGSNRLSSVTGAPTRIYAYDVAGNATGDGARSFTYNNAGRMTSLTNGAVITSYAFNALGERVKKSSPLSTTYFVYDEAGHLIGEYNAAGNIVEETVWMGDIPVATLQFGTSALKTYYVHTDHLNTPRRITNRNTNIIVWRWDSDPFGNGAAVQNPQGSVTVSYNLRYPGQYFDSETGLFYNYFRDFDPAVGRYVESDLIGLDGGINTYAYALGNPISLVDSRGLDAWVIINNNGWWGTHAGLYVDSGERALYDPGGSYRDAEKGSGDALYGSYADISDYIKYEKQDGPDVEVFHFPTTPQQDKQIIDKIQQQGGCQPLFCTVCVSRVLRGIGPFKNLGLSRTPAGLARDLRALQKK